MRLIWNGPSPVAILTFFFFFFFFFFLETISSSDLYNSLPALNDEGNHEGALEVGLKMVDLYPRDPRSHFEAGCVRA